MAKSATSCPFSSTIGLKVVMGVTGGALFLFTIIHMLGNLQVFLPPAYLNSYAHHLQSLPWPILWGARLGLLLMVVLHIASVIQLIRINRAAHPQAYEVKNALGTTLASRIMAVSGFILLAFILFHLWQFTIRGTPFEGYNAMWTTIDFDGKPTQVPDVFKRVVDGFSHPLISLFYIVSVGLLCLHLSHGAQSMFRSLGLGTSNTFGWQKVLAKIMALVIFLGMAAVPLAVLLGVIKINPS